MRHFKSISFYFLIVLQLLIVQLHGQQLPFQSLSLAGGYYVPTNVDGLQMDWRLDIGLTAMTLEHSNAYLFSASFLQPTINRFTDDMIWKKYNPSIEIKNTFSRSEKAEAGQFLPANSEITRSSRRLMPATRMLLFSFLSLASF